jgi:hypothetical protein
MVSAQLAKVISDVLSSKTRTILIVLSVMAGLIAVGSILSARTLLSQAVDESYGAANYFPARSASRLTVREVLAYE